MCVCARVREWVPVFKRVSKKVLPWPRISGIFKFSHIRLRCQGEKKPVRMGSHFSRTACLGQEGCGKLHLMLPDAFNYNY